MIKYFLWQTILIRQPDAILRPTTLHNTLFVAIVVPNKLLNQRGNKEIASTDIPSIVLKGVYFKSSFHIPSHSLTHRPQESCIFMMKSFYNPSGGAHQKQMCVCLIQVTWQQHANTKLPPDTQLPNYPGLCHGICMKTWLWYVSFKSGCRSDNLAQA